MTKRGTHILEMAGGGEGEQVRTWKESDQARGTYPLVTIERETGQNSVRTWKEMAEASQNTR